MVADSIIYHPTLSKLLKFLDSTPKREKALRLVTYVSRLLAYYLHRKGYSGELVQKFVDLKQHGTFIRKALRLFKPLAHLQAASQAYDNKVMDRVLSRSTVVRNLGYAGYLGLDTVTFFKMLGLVDKKKFPKVATWAARCWGVALAAGMVNSFRSYHISAAKLGSVEEKVDIEALEQKQFQAKRKLAWDALDMFVCLNSLGYLHFSEGDVGFAGTLTSLMGLRDLWAST
ncbi:hypothetical protein JCM33374_g3998 [Metschnikowia sp. JCM 33374]|nr:hypothetical protein JCM33374_g3998 [Metschnikowia sp. JCM 33374]